ncbi:type II toxin-antitoxin system HicA family toxin [Methylobacter tundripaludum]|uniref:type II toxin-antitoxin system HicA family toxin n=1 Tax=Methylobacter tundripaludum TaxID=173365 RepID=UPI00068ADFD3|nr:type II toxin-antitoxin system HicA family toxin [Methylobacter tundripaludum]
MGQLGGFCYREIVKRLKQLGFQFDRQAAGSHEIWYNPGTSRYTTIPNHPGDMPEGTLRAILKQAGISRYRVLIPINGQQNRRSCLFY